MRAGFTAAGDGAAERAGCLVDAAAGAAASLRSVREGRLGWRVDDPMNAALDLTPMSGALSMVRTAMRGAPVA